MEFAREIVSTLRTTFADDPTGLAAAFAARASLLLDSGFLSAARLAEELSRESLDIRSREMPESWLVDNSRSIHGAIRMERSRLDPDLNRAQRLELLAEARTLLHQGYEGLMQADEKEHPVAIPIRRREAAQRLVRLYEQLHELEPDAGHDASAQRYRAE